MSRALITINGSVDRARAAALLAKAPTGTRIEFKAAKRSLPQNDKMWAALTDVSAQLVWHGEKLRPDDWKIVFLDALKREKRAVRSIEGDGFVSLGSSSSDLTKEEFSELIELIHAFGAKHGVVFGDPAEREAA